MSSISPINQVVQIVGMRKLASYLGVSYQAIQRYLMDNRVPAEKVLNCAEAVNFQVTPHQLRPDLYPHPDDGLPPAQRCQCVDPCLQKVG